MNSLVCFGIGKYNSRYIDELDYSVDDVIEICSETVENITVSMPRSNKQRGKFSRKTSLSSDASTRFSQHLNINENIVGLDNRDLITLNILCDENGAPFKTYTEHDDIPREDIQSAHRIFTSRVPSPRQSTRTSFTKYGDESMRDVLINMDWHKKLKMMKKVQGTLMKLNTTDTKTAKCFLKTDRYIEVKDELQNIVISFLAKELKVTVFNFQHSST